MNPIELVCIDEWDMPAELHLPDAASVVAVQGSSASTRTHRSCI